MVGIVVVTYNRLSLLKECIDALRHQTYEKSLEKTNKKGQMSS